MVKDHWFGLGTGNYSAFSWYKYGELANDRMIPGNLLQNFLLLNLAELGFLGLFAFLCIWFRYYQFISRMHKVEQDDFTKPFLFLLKWQFW